MSRVASSKTKTAKKEPGNYLFRLIVRGMIVAVVTSFALFFLKYTSTLTPCANSISCIKDLSTHVENDAVGTFEGQKVNPPKIDLAQDNFKPAVLGADAEDGPKHIYIDLTSQTLSAFQGNKLVMTTKIASGKWFPTPTGEYTIWVKIRAQRMSGGIGADYYDLPNVPYVMFFYNNEVSKSKGYSLHGAYWHNNFGHPMSHGCVNMRIADAKALYQWVNPVIVNGKTTTYATKDDPGTPVTIFGVTPIN